MRTSYCLPPTLVSRVKPKQMHVEEIKGKGIIIETMTLPMRPMQDNPFTRALRLVIREQNKDILNNKQGELK